ncbi:hypothetical protein DSM106972_071600 [Dulcicalothrix desertica PCC 7102]|uniref:Uncharacterized protein n=1 Tax=Dulcicalothrix desertica PCC 7102 TaxID=232991 RepID=A0A3S1AHP9_9CYAN|nr:hypothetical protein [Dulcicalothrix desertica]RUT00751.1 hypothetical protein DSM106972_071600 [Dulcicalothrix desertica PCC 7102]TWH42406.1 hypothetical protein CAL7102_06057 [Dulcicalothrix desertica PCC 7102]
MNSLNLQIHEFSREFIDIREKDGKLVSGGFGASEIAHETHPVPDKIKQAVNRGDLRINDSYPPLQQEFALLAKEIDEYAILAVATREHDDKNRPLIAYRYFWLEKPENNSNDDIDGIGTLILWWQDSKQPKFNFKNSNNHLQYNVDTCSKTEIYTLFQQNFGTIFTELIAELKLSPYVVVKDVNETNSYFKLHYLTLHLNREFQAPLSWAWNVDIIENPKQFTNIWVANKNTSVKITSEIKHQKSQEPKTTSIKDLEKFLNKQPKQEKANHASEENLKQLILNAINIEQTSHLSQIIFFLNEYLIHNYEKDNVIDTVKFNLGNYSYMPVKEAVIYRAILVLLGFDDLFKWTQWLNNELDSDEKELSFKIQSFLIELSINNQSHNAYNQLQSLIFHNYSNLLLQLSNISTDSKEYKFATWLLFESKSIWRYYFKRYTQNIVKTLINQDVNLFYPDNELYNLLITNISEYETSRPQPLKNLRKQYKTLSLLLQKLGNNSLSALFYQLSEGAVPKDVYQRADVQIIPLTRKQTVTLAIKLRTFISEYKLVIIALTCIFISITGISWKLATEYLPQWQQNSSKN